MTTPTRQTGFSLIELMIAALIGTILLAAVVLIAMNASESQRNLEQIGRQLENGRYAMNVLGEEIPHAGYYGEFYSIDPGSGTPDPCTTNVANIEAALWLPIQAYDSPAGDPPPNCIGDGGHADNTDILVVRRTSTQTTPVGSLTAGELYLQSRPFNKVLAQADGTETDPFADSSNDPGQFTLQNRAGTALAPIRKFRVDSYYIDPDFDGDGVPTLVRRQLRENGGTLQVVDVEPIAAGIENFQVDYGIDRDDDGSPEESNPGTSGDAYVTAPAAGNEGDVVSVRIHLVARSIEPVEGYSDEKTLNLGAEGTVGPAQDEFRRRVFVSTIRAVNPALRRE